MPLKQRAIDRICAAPLEGYSSAFSNMQARLLSHDVCVYFLTSRRLNCYQSSLSNARVHRNFWLYLALHSSLERLWTFHTGNAYLTSSFGGPSSEYFARKLREFDEKVSALDVRQRCIDDTERDLKDRITELKRQERILHVLKEDHLSAVRRCV
jgi:hypothetical protein